ncbi:uncharacterized protein LOC119992075 [Tripterygium wilfordii]|uniref:uncharacterized protein LOC119992075 n=1 Tax=Tripterygium wilfordii TaxID=458696 RepID=UPI0018F8381D|nr:uncharacterized protein LOC119992075 [Tripterygium wilfordii]
MKPEKSNSRGFRLRSILISSLSSTVLGIIIFRLATANTQNVVYVKLFAIVGVILATGPWIIQLLLSTITMVLYKAGIHDLTWLLMHPSDEAVYCCQEDDLKRMVDGHARRYNTNIGFGTVVPVNARRGPRLQRNRTI